MSPLASSARQQLACVVVPISWPAILIRFVETNQMGRGVDMHAIKPAARPSPSQIATREPLPIGAATWTSGGSFFRVNPVRSGADARSSPRVISSDDGSPVLTMASLG